MSDPPPGPKRKLLRLQFVHWGAGLCLSLCLGCSSLPWPSRIVYDREASDFDEFSSASKRPPTAKTLYAMARLLRSQGRHEEYEAVLLRITRQHPRFWPVYADLAEHQMAGGRIDQAITTLQAGLRQVGRDPVLLNNLGMCHLAARRYEDALAWFADAATVRPNHPRYRTNMAVALGMLGRDREAEQLYLQVLSPADAEHNLAVLRRARQQGQPSANVESPHKGATSSSPTRAEQGNVRAIEQVALHEPASNDRADSPRVWADIELPRVRERLE